MKKLLLMCLVVIMGTLMNAQINLGSGTSTTDSSVPVPWSHYYGYSYVQQIILRQEINASAPGTITGVTFYAGSGLTLADSNNVTVYVGHTTKTIFSSATDWIPASGLTQVYTGTVTNTAGQISVTFTTPFAYNNVDNLVIAIDENSPSYDTNGPSSETFYKYNGYANSTLYYRDDTTNPDPAAPTVTGTRSSYHSRMTLQGLTPGQFPTCPVVTWPVNDAVNISTAPVITWDAVAGATGYKISIGSTPAGTDVLAPTVVTAANYTAPALAYGTIYYITVVASNANGDSQSCLSVKFTTVPAAPANNECSGALQLTVNPALTCAVTTAGTTVGATGSGITMASPCSTTANGDDDVWFKFTATGPAHTVTLTNITSQGATTATDAYIQVMSGTCGTLASALCSDPNSMTVSGLTAGTEYFVRVFTVGESIAGSRYINFDICVATLPPPPSNDDCGGAIVLMPSLNGICATPVAGTTLAATASGQAMGTCTGTADDDVWYSFVATSPTHNVMLSNVVSVGTTSSTSLYLQVFSGSCAGLTSLACDTTTTTPAPLTGLTVGNTYYVRVYNSAAGAGNANTFNICIVTPVAPANDNCANATVLSSAASTACIATVSGTTLGATNSSVPVGTCSGTPDDDVWYSFVATNTAHIVTLSNVISAGTGTNSTSLYLQAFSGACGSLTSILCDTSYTSAAQLNGLTVGNTYYVRVYNSNGTGYANTFNICVTTPPPPPANDTCATALVGQPIDSSTPYTNTQDAGSASNTGGFVAACSDNAGMNDGVWYTVVGDGGTMTVTAAPTGWDPEVGVYTGTCGTFTCVTSADSSGSGSAETVTFLSTVGTTYYINVGHYSGTSDSPEGTFSITIATTGSLKASDVVANGKELKVYPNPFTDIVNISDAKDLKSLSVVDMSGRLVKTIANPGRQVNLSELKSGMYILKMDYKDGSVKTVKLIKK